MLKTLLNLIDNIPNIPFQEFYSNYVMDVQDKNIELEFDLIKDKHSLAPIKMIMLANKDMERLVKLLDRNNVSKK